MEPGGQGWNDPPNLSFQIKSQTTTRKNNLTKRVGAQDLNLTPAKSEANTFLKPDEGPPIAGDSIINSTASNKLQNVEGANSGEVNEVDVYKSLMDLIETCLNNKVTTIHVKKNVGTKLKYLKNSLENPEYPKQIKIKMAKLTLLLLDDKYEDAWNIHTELMCDYSSQVTQWMVGVKKIITEVKKMKAAEENNLK